MNDSLRRLSVERIARRARCVNDLTVLIYKRVNGLSFTSSNNYALLFADALVSRKCIASPVRPNVQADFVHIPVGTNGLDCDQSISLLLLLEELLETQMTILKKVDTVNQRIDYVVIEPIGSGSLISQLTA